MKNKTTYYCFYQTKKSISVHDMGTKEKCLKAKTERDNTIKWASQMLPHISNDGEKCYIKSERCLNDLEKRCINSPQMYLRDKPLTEKELLEFYKAISVETIITIK